MKIRIAEEQDLSYIEGLYLEAFPKVERKPFKTILKMRQKGQCHLYVIEKEAQPLGLAAVIVHDDTALLDYFAIDCAARGSGLGGAALDLLCEIYSDRAFFLEIERVDEQAVNYTQRLARKSFYLKHGFVETDEYIRLFGVEMEILSSRDPIDFQRCEPLYRKIYSPIYSVVVKRI